MASPASPRLNTPFVPALPNVDRSSPIEGFPRFLSAIFNHPSLIEQVFAQHLNTEESL